MGLRYLRGTIAVYIEPSPRERENEKGDRVNESKKCQAISIPHLLQVHPSLALLLFKLVGLPGTESYAAPSPNIHLVT